MIAFVAFAALFVSNEPDRVMPARPGATEFCGPRCVYHVLRHFGKDVELTDLITEISGPDPRRDSSLAELSDAMRNHGVSSKAVTLGLLDVPSWNGPVILHIDGNHFVVLEKTGRFTVTVKDGMLPATDISLWELKRRGSALMLLTADRPITDEPFSRGEYRYGTIALGILLILGGIRGAAWKRRKRSMPASGPAPRAPGPRVEALPQ